MRIEIGGVDVLNSVDFKNSKNLEPRLRLSEYFLEVAEKNPNQDVCLINDDEEIIGFRHDGLSPLYS